MPDRLTNRHLQSARPGDELADSIVRGLRFRVSNKGARSFHYRYRHAENGALRRIVIGSYANSAPPKSLEQAREENRYTLEQARQECSHLRQLRAQGLDPQAWRRQEVAEQRAENTATLAQAEAETYTVEQLCKDWLRAKHAGWRPSTERGITRIVNVEILARWGRRPVASLRRGDIADARDAIARKGGVLANRALWTIKALLDYAVEHEKIEANPAASLKRAHRERPRERVLSRTELATLVRALPRSPMRDDFRDALRLLLLTGVRNSEACGAMRAEVDFEAGVWTVPKARNKSGRDHRVMLSRQARELLADRIQQAPEAGRLFPKPRGKASLDANDVGKRVRELVEHLGMEPWTAHDLRATMASHLAELGYPPEITDERMLCHAVRGVRRHYDFAKRDKPAAEAWQAWADLLDTLAEPVVVPMERGA